MLCYVIVQYDTKTIFQVLVIHFSVFDHHRILISLTLFEESCLNRYCATNAYINYKNSITKFNREHHCHETNWSSWSIQIRANVLCTKLSIFSFMTEWLKLSISCSYTLPSVIDRRLTLIIYAYNRILICQLSVFPIDAQMRYVFCFDHMPTRFLNLGRSTCLEKKWCHRILEHMDLIKVSHSVVDRNFVHIATKNFSNHDVENSSL